MKMLRPAVRFVLAAFFAVVAFGAWAQVPSYGTSINLEQAKKVLAAAQTEARKNSWPVAIAVLDTSGNLVAFEKSLS